MLEYYGINISEGIDIKKKQTHQKNVNFVIIGALEILFLSMNHIFVMFLMV